MTEAALRKCDSCQRNRITALVTFKRNVSYFFRRHETTFSGRVCFSCMTRRFVGFEIVTLIGTWWGIIGLILGPIFIVTNLFEYLGGSFDIGRAAIKFHKSKSSANLIRPVTTIDDEAIVSAFAELMATGDVKPDAFYDVWVLPHPKEDILLAIEREILREPLDARVEWLAVGAGFLPSFQSGVGPKPLFWCGADLAKLQQSTPNVSEQIKMVGRSPDRERANHFFAVMENESKQIRTRIDTVLRLRKARLNHGAAEAAKSKSENAPTRIDQEREVSPTKQLERDTRVLEQGKRGSITFKEGERAKIVLSKDSDASTFLYLMAMQWLNELMADAANEHAPNELRNDARIVRDWLGVKEGDEISKKAYERFARGFETYLMEGHFAPGHLSTVADSLKLIYREGDDLHPSISYKIRRVFSRLVGEQS